MVVADDLLVDVTKGVTPGDRRDDDDRQPVAAPEPDAEHGGDGEREIAESNLGLKSTVATREADFPRDARSVEEVGEAADDAGHPIVTTIHQSSTTSTASYRPQGRFG